MNNTNKILNLYILVIAAIFSVMTLWYAATALKNDRTDEKIKDISSGWTYESSSGSRVIHWTETRRLMDEEMVVLSKVVDRDIREIQSIIFFDTNTRVKAYLNDALFYETGYTREDTLRWEGTWNWHIIELPYYVKEGDVLRIEIERFSPKFYGMSPRMVYLADVNQFFDMILMKSFVGLVICLVIFLSAIMLLLLWIIRCGWKRGQWISLNIALFAIAASIAMILRIPWMTWIYNGSFFPPFFSAYAGLATVLPVMCFSNQISGSYYQKIYRLLWLYAATFIIVRILGQIGGYSRLLLLYPYEHRMILFAGGFYFLVVIMDYIQNCCAKKPSRHYLMIVLAGVALLLDILLVRQNIFYFSNVFFGLASLFGILNITRSSANALAVTYQDSIDAQKYQLLSETDVLTGLKNRNCYSRRIEAIQIEEGFGAVIMDVNNLKAVNDYYGHQEGDRLLVLVANTIQRVFDREQHELFRIGGDEFAIFAYHHTLDQTLEHIGEFHQQINSMGKDKPYQVSVAVGYAMYDPLRKESIEELVQRADHRMYLEKMKKVLDRE